MERIMRLLLSTCLVACGCFAGTLASDLANSSLVGIDLLSTVHSVANTIALPATLTVDYGYISGITGETGFTAGNFVAGKSGTTPYLSSYGTDYTTLLNDAVAAANACGAAPTFPSCTVLNETAPSTISTPGSYAYQGAMTQPLTISGTGPFFIYLDAAGENFEGADNITLINGATANNVFFYIPNGNVTIAGIAGTTFGGTLILGGTGTATIENTTTFEGRLLTADQINLANFSNGPLVINPASLTPEPSTMVFSGIAGVWFLLYVRSARRKRSC